MKRHVLGLFSGIGAFEEGCRRNGLNVGAVCEIDPYCQKVLRRHFPTAKLFGDVHDVTADTLGFRPFIVTGGFPCQDLSVANPQAEGIDGKRSGLWREMHRVIAETRPRWVVTENVPALRNRGYDRIVSDLAGIGYTGRAFVVGADDCGAPHVRKRVFIIANADGPGELQREGAVSEQRGRVDYRPSPASRAAAAKNSEVSNTADAEDLGRGTWGLRLGAQAQESFSALALENAEWSKNIGRRMPEPLIRRMDDGATAELDKADQRLKALGNAIVLRVAEAVVRSVLNVDAQLDSGRMEAAEK